MEKDKLKAIEKEEIKQKGYVGRKLAETIELSFESFGIICKVVEYNSHPDNMEFCLELALGTPLDKVTKHHKDIAMAVSSPTGEVEIEAPIPGKSLFAVRVPIKTGWIKMQYEYQKKLEIDVKEITEKGKIINKEIDTNESSWPGLRVIIAAIFYMIGDLLIKLGNLIRGKKNA